MDLSLSILFLLLLLPVNAENLTNRLVPTHCKYMLLESIVFQRWCVGSYPWMAHIKYRDKLINIGEPYALYLPRSEDSILVVQKKSPLLNCRNLVFKDCNTFFCLDRNRNETLSLRDARIYCFPFHIKLPDDLMIECFKQKNMKNQDEYRVKVLGARRGILHYTLDKGGAKSLRRIMYLTFLTVLTSFLII
ncbi:hypothetical protein KR054_001741 [Drosophila jambulina]|nr:hypothetical protein KR054_001741 [Drosophila jambulina]